MTQVVVSAIAGHELPVSLTGRGASWYYLAAYHALLGNAVESAECLTRALEHGSEYLELALRDPSFARVRDTSFFRDLA